MVQEAEAQAITSKAKGGRKGKIMQLRAIDNEATNKSDTKVINDNAKEETDSNSDHDNNGKQYNFHTLAKLLEPIPKLTSHNYYSWSAHINTIDTTREFNINYLILDIIRENHMVHDVWKKIENGLTNEATAISHHIALIAQLGELRMYNSDARKLIQEIRTIQMESSLLGKPFANDTLFSNLQKCTIQHPMYKETVTTMSQLSFSTLATALSIWQSVIENNPALRVDPRQASARVASSDDQDKPPRKDKKDEKDTNSTSTKVAARPRRLQCWICKRPGHGINSGASYHMVNDYSMLIGPKTCRKRILTAGSEVLEATAIGDASISTNTGDIFLQNVFMLLKMIKNREQGLLEFQGNTWQENTMITSTSLFEGVDDDFE
ncbi:uncharacterized protein UHO2_00421 [Ustilago hordei]|uniref:uncharacterized protein n=1 Tax=Ustilago hordei TaxID=120017 RepID=UPI001A536817|nr:uncharacterized protein UHO2_00421 [Ustilago hordei]SYW81934.1 uncharacterized protein UHO2_00421 [Ustilago hordei]